MNAFIIRIFQILVYLLFLVIAVGGSVGGYFFLDNNMSYYGSPHPGMVAGVIAGSVVAAVLTTGLLVLLLDIRSQLIRLNSKS